MSGLGSSDSESEEDGDQRRRDGARNAFAGLNMDSDSSSSEEEDDDGDDNHNNVQTQQRETETATADDNSSSTSSNEEEEDDNTKNDQIPVSTFEDLIGRVTSNGVPVSADFVDAIQESIEGNNSSSNIRPTEIQQQSWSALFSPSTCHRDVIAISKTGSGKTLAFLVPLLASLAQNEKANHSSNRKFVHPRAIILTPTRVLAMQIFEVATALVANTPSLKDQNVKVSVALGGTGYHQQMANLLETNPDLVIATPGRLNSLCGKGAKEKNADDDLDTKKVELCIKVDEVVELVVDEADLMLSLGFAADLSWFAKLVNMESAYGFRLVLTSATWDEQTSANLSLFESISEEEPVLVKTGGKETGQVVSRNVTQRCEVLFQKGAPRFNRLCKLLEAALIESNIKNNTGEDDSRIIVFCLHKSQARQIGKDLKCKADVDNIVLEGDMSQKARAAAITAFRNGSRGKVLVATDVAARGLDFNVSHVFNYSLGISIESYIHRCGRTGRAGRYGVSHTFVVKGIDEKFTPELVLILQKASQLVEDDLRIMATKEIKRRKQRVPGIVPGSPSSKVNDDEDDIEEARQANREKQLRLNRQRQSTSKQQQKRRGKR